MSERNHRTNDGDASHRQVIGRRMPLALWCALVVVAIVAATPSLVRAQAQVRPSGTAQVAGVNDGRRVLATLIVGVAAADSRDHADASMRLTGGRDTSSALSLGERWARIERRRRNATLGALVGATAVVSLYAYECSHTECITVAGVLPMTVLGAGIGIVAALLLTPVDGTLHASR